MNALPMLQNYSYKIAIFLTMVTADSSNFLLKKDIVKCGKKIIPWQRRFHAKIAKARVARAQ